MDTSSQLHAALKSRLHERSFSPHREKHYRDGRWRFGCSANENYFTIRYNPADRTLSIFDRAWPFDSFRWKHSLANTANIPDIVVVALEIITPAATQTYRPIADWTPKLPTISDASFQTLFETHSCLAIHFWAPWNGVDPPTHDALCQARDSLATEVACYSCDIDKNTQLPTLISINNIPAIAVIQDARLKHILIGLHSAKRIELDIRQALEIT